ncbi:TPA: gp53-like domain-containing protein [Escherichia coli]
MAGTNDFKAFATDANANVTSQEEWETLTALKKGFSSGKASSAQVSKALRQPSTMAAVLGQFIANAELDALDDGDVDGLVAKLATAITTNLGLGDAAKKNVGTGSGQIPDMSSFGNQRADSGYQYLPGGLILQWAITKTKTSPETVSFPIAFPNRALCVVATDQSVGGVGQGFVLTAQNFSSTDFQLRAYQAGTNAESSIGAGGFNYFAVGY